MSKPVESCAETLVRSKGGWRVGERKRALPPSDHLGGLLDILISERKS